MRAGGNVFKPAGTYAGRLAYGTGLVECDPRGVIYGP